MYNTEGKTLLQTLQYEKLAQHLSMHKEAKRGKERKKEAKTRKSEKEKLPTSRARKDTSEERRKRDL